VSHRGLFKNYVIHVEGGIKWGATKGDKKTGAELCQAQVELRVAKLRQFFHASGRKQRSKKTLRVIHQH
jgi:hypothetical protein